MTEPQRRRLSSWIAGALGIAAALALLPSPAAFLPLLVAQFFIKGLRAGLAPAERPLELMGATGSKLYLAYLLVALVAILWLVLRRPEAAEAAIDTMTLFFVFMAAVFLPVLLVSARSEWALFREEADGPP